MPQCELRGKFPIYDETVKWSSGKTSVLNTIPRSVVSLERSQYSTVGKGLGFGVGQSCPWNPFTFICVTLIQLTSLSLSIPMCKMGIIIVLSHTVVKGLQEMIFGISPGTQFPYMLVIVVIKISLCFKQFCIDFLHQTLKFRGVPCGDCVSYSS